MLSIPAPSNRSDANIDGLQVTDSQWRLDTSRYRPFLEAATGLSPNEELSGSDCYRIGNRLEALIEDKQRKGEWTDALVETYPVVESLEEIRVLARFFRHCHRCRMEGIDC